jgi:hypothetical protein
MATISAVDGESYADFLSRMQLQSEATRVNLLVSAQGLVEIKGDLAAVRESLLVLGLLENCPEIGT